METIRAMAYIPSNLPLPVPAPTSIPSYAFSGFAMVTGLMGVSKSLPAPQSELDIILNYGREEAQGISEISNRLVEFYDAESDKIIGVALTKLHAAAESFGVARGMVPWIARKVNINYDFKISERDLMRGKEVINGVIQELNKNLANVKTDVENIDSLITSLRDYYDKLSYTIKLIDGRLIEKRGELTADSFTSNIAKSECTEAIRMLEQKRIDLVESQQTSELIAAQLQMVKSNNFDLYCMLMSRIVSRVPTMLASVTVKTIMNRGRKTLDNIKEFDKGGDKLLLNNMKEVNRNLKDTIAQSSMGSLDRANTLEIIRSEIVSTTIEIDEMRQSLFKKQKEALAPITQGIMPR